jgi:hypothetical protein
VYGQEIVLLEENNALGQTGATSIIRSHPFHFMIYGSLIWLRYDFLVNCNCLPLTTGVLVASPFETEIFASVIYELVRFSGWRPKRCIRYD